MVVVNFFMLCLIAVMTWGIGEHLAEEYQKDKK